MKLIDKDALLAEIERKQKEEVSYYENGSFASWSDENHYFTLEDIKSFIDTLEVKDVDLKNSMVCKVDWYDGFLLDYTQEQQDELLKKIGSDVGDKIRVILMKE